MVSKAKKSKSDTRQQADANVEYDAFLAACPSRDLLARLSNKWVVLVLAALGGGDFDPVVGACDGEPRALRYSELSRLLVGVSQKMLTQTLRSLERDGLVLRTVVPTVPVTVSYELTELGLSLYDTVKHVKQWAQTNMDEVLASRNDYDTRPS